MKLRNKKTGEIKSIEEIIRDAFLSNELDSLKSIDTNWEDVDVTNATNIPLIKDEKIRKAVKAWAEANKEEELEVMGGCSITAFKSLYNHTEIDFNCSWKLRDSVYTIEELCGEEEE